MSQRIWFLKRCDLFEQLTPEQLTRLESQARIRRYERNSAIYLPGDSADGVLLLSEGRVRICDFTPDGKQAILAFIEPGEMFGELALIDAHPREERAEAATPATVILIPGEAMQRLMESVPNLFLGITKLIGFRRRRIERRLKMLLFRSNRERLTHLLLELAEQYGRSDPAGIRIDIRLSHQDLANIIGSTRETVTITLGELQNEGVIRIARRTVILTHPERLVASSDLVPAGVLGMLNNGVKSSRAVTGAAVNPEASNRRM
jgi:CRP-like cAMP-binding protein